MAKSAVSTARLDAQTLALVDKVAGAQRRTRSWFAAEAIRRMAESEADFMAFVQTGIESADHGELTPKDRVFADLRQRRGLRGAA